jgi:hypothetical protein
MIRLIVRIDEASMAAHVGGSPQTTYRTFDIDHPQIEALLRGGGSNNQNEFSYRTLVGAELIEESSQ